MISGFENAVGPIHPSEHPQLVLWPCQIAFERGGDGADCSYQLFDGGTGRTLLHCQTHAYWFVAADWSSPHFSGKSLVDYIEQISFEFERVRAAGRFSSVRPDRVSVGLPSLGDLFEAILANVEAMARELERQQSE